MKFFLDTANLDELRKAAAWGIIDGVTTNPSLIAKEQRPTDEQIRAICDIVDGDVSAEEAAMSSDEMVREGRELARSPPQRGGEGPADARRHTRLFHPSREAIRVNVTLCFSATQAILAAKAGAYIVSPFIGRLDDIGVPGIDLIRDIVTIYKNYGFATQILAASLRSPMHVLESAKAGAHIATMPFKVVDMLFHHPLTDKGLEQFLSDYAKAFQETPALAG